MTTQDLGSNIPTRSTQARWAEEAVAEAEREAPHAGGHISAEDLVAASVKKWGDVWGATGTLSRQRLQARNGGDAAMVRLSSSLHGD